MTVVLQASLLAVFAYIGFEGISNIAEETVRPRTTLPRAILATLVISTVIYVLTVGVALLTIGPQAIASHPTPLSHLFTRTTGLPAAIITIIAVIATVNGIIVQIIAVSRLLYGLAMRELLPGPLKFVDPRRGTPVVAIAVVTVAIVVLSLSVPVVALAEWTARIILAVFAVVCAGLTWLKWRGVGAGEDSFTVPIVRSGARQHRLPGAVDRRYRRHRVELEPFRPSWKQSSRQPPSRPSDGRWALGLCTAGGPSREPGPRATCGSRRFGGP